MRGYQVVLLAVAALLASTDAATEIEQSKMAVPETPAWVIPLAAEGNDGAAKRFLRSETTIAEEEADEEERVMPGTAAAEKLIPKLQKVLSNKQLVSQKEETQFALRFVTGRAPGYVAKNILKVDPLSSTGKAIAVYHRYTQWFQQYFSTGGIRFHTSN
ncbi:hypothetical protein PRIC1_007129 [Phytophthora ramorum]